MLDVNGDYRADIAGVRTSDRALLRWSGRGNGTFGAAIRLGKEPASFRLARY